MGSCTSLIVQACMSSFTPHAGSEDFYHRFLNHPFQHPASTTLLHHTLLQLHPPPPSITHCIASSPLPPHTTSSHHLPTPPTLTSSLHHLPSLSSCTTSPYSLPTPPSLTHSPHHFPSLPLCTRSASSFSDWTYGRAMSSSGALRFSSWWPVLAQRTHSSTSPTTSRRQVEPGGQESTTQWLRNTSVVGFIVIFVLVDLPGGSNNMGVAVVV